MKVQVLVSKPKSLDITLNEMMEKWHMLELIPGLECHFYTYDKSLTSEEISNIIDSDTEAVIGVYLRKDLITEDFFIKHPKLKYMAGMAHGYEEFDVELTHKYGVTITNTAYGASTIAEFAFALLLDICHKVELHSSYVKTHDWVNDPSPRYMFGLSDQIELNGMTFGIIGLGKIGYHAALIAKGFGMNVISFNRHLKTGAEYDLIEQVSLDEVLSRSDVISLHTPLTDATKNIINKESIAKMKDGVILINTSRGGLINEDDLVNALNSGKIYAAGLDVISEEPPRHDLGILHCENATITDHIAYLPKTSRLRSVSVAISNFKAYLDGCPTSVINK